jgi:pimeloyl-ACP methyl ester carboxylesterase
LIGGVQIPPPSRAPTIRRTLLEEDTMECAQPLEGGAVAEELARERSGSKPAEVRRVAGAVLDGPGETPNTLRRSVEARAARLGGGEREQAPIPSELEGYVNKVALYAYKVTDEDVEALKARDTRKTRSSRSPSPPLLAPGWPVWRRGSEI